MIQTSYTAADVAALSALHRRAFPDFFLSRLGEPFLRQFYLGYLDDPDAVVAVARAADGRIVGAAVGSTRPAGFFSRLLVRRLAGFVGASILAALRDPRTVPRLLAAVKYRGDQPPGSEGALLSSLCVDPSCRAAGIGGALDEAWRQRAVELGARTAFLTTDALDNEPVNLFHQRNGWQLTDQFTTPQGRRMNRYRHDLPYSEGRDGD